MKTIANGALYPAVLITALFMPAASFAQSWEPENVWKVDHEDWNVSSMTSKQTPSNTTAPSSQIRPNILPNIEVEDIKTSERCEPITIKAKILDYTSISQVFIYYASGNLNYTMLPMKTPLQAPNKFIATLPETATQGDYIDYYIEAFNSQKTLVTSSGNALTPTRIFLTGECPEQATNPPKVNQPSKQATNPQTVNPPTKQTTNPQTVNPPTNEGDSLNDDIYDEIFAKKTPSASGNTARSQANSSPKTTTQPKTTDTKQTPPKNSNALQTTNELLNQSAQTQNTPNTHLSSSDDILSYPNFQFSVMLGTGVGITGDKTENCDGNAKCMSNGGSVSSISTGVSSLPLHLRASAMFNLPKHFQIGAYLRGQLINIVKDTLTPNAKTNVKNPEQYNIMFGLTARYLILWKQPYRLYIGLEFGWGGANATVNMFNNFKDIYLYKGPWHIAPEIGFLWNFHKNIGLAFELTIPIVFPERPSAFFDLSIGPYIQF